MKLLIEERRELSKCYFDLKEKLANLEKTNSNFVSTPENVRETTLSKDVENQKYILSKKRYKQSSIPYQDIAIKIASILKEAGQPVSTKEIYDVLKDNYNYSLSYNNLVSNILPRINGDSTINVEKSCRGYWQYRQK